MKFNTSNTLERNQADAYYQKLTSGGSNIELKKINQPKSVSQNSYLHACISLFGIEFGYTLAEAKVLLKRECYFMIYSKNDKLFVKSTIDLDKEQLTKFIEWIRNYSSKAGFYIPTSEEYLTNKFSIDKDIDRHRVYL